MGKPPSDDEPKGSEPGESTADPDRAAILARRQRFIALALSGLAAACDKPQSGATKPEDPKHEGKDDEANPEPCLKVAIEPDVPDAKPVPCLEVVAPEPGEDDAGTPAPCLKVAAPEPTEPPPQPCLRVVAPPPDPSTDKSKPEPCLKVAAPPPEEPAKPRPCLKIAKPKE